MVDCVVDSITCSTVDPVCVAVNIVVINIVEFFYEAIEVETVLTIPYLTVSDIIVVSVSAKYDTVVVIISIAVHNVIVC
jgi:hypothetical protein